MSSIKNQRQSFSSRSHSNYEYPNRTEAPVITRSVASSLDIHQEADECRNLYPYSNASLNSSFDPFDDTNTLTPFTRQDIREKQKDNIKSNLPSIFAIHSNPPQSVPPNLPHTSMSHPSTEITTLSNGIRVVSQETYGQVTTFGVLSNFGSRLETESNVGVNHLMELLAFSGTPRLTSSNFQTKLDSLGGVSFASSSREQFLYCIDVLRPNVTEAMDLLRDVILQPKLDEMTINEMKRVVEYQWMDMMPEVLLSEGLQIAGYGPINGKIQQLGKNHFCTTEVLANIHSGTINKFRDEYLMNPELMVVCAAGMQHEDLVRLAQTNFGDLQKSQKHDNLKNGDNMAISQYTGGSHNRVVQTPDGFTRVALAFPTGGWHSDDLVPACVLQTLLGGGSSFSAGGPGKGMYSRLYRQVLNRYYWAETCESFASFYNESGLLGISGSAVGVKAGDLTKVLVENMMRLTIDEVADEELSRARNMLKCNVLTQLESRLVLFEDLGRQILTYDKREGTDEMCKKIDSVDKETIKNLVRKSVIGMKPTVCAVGDDINHVPSFEEVENWFLQLK